MNLIFPIFLFGCTMAGVVMLGIIEAREQVKRAESARKMEDANRGVDKLPNIVPPSRNPKVTHTSHE